MYTPMANAAFPMSHEVYHATMYTKQAKDEDVPVIIANVLDETDAQTALETVRAWARKRGVSL